MTILENHTVRYCNITAIVTAYNRIDQTLVTLQKILVCNPCPSEILVHVDANQTQCESAIRRAFPDVRILRSESCVGPGGGRNKLMAVATNEFVASFDDDSYPIDTDYFTKVMELFKRFPAASILTATVYHRGETVTPAIQAAEWVSDFSGGACIYDRKHFLSTNGYVPLPVAYGMEEVDLALRLHAQGGKILRTSSLRVFHDTDLTHHATARVTKASIANLALLAYLRYPPSLWLLGFLQCSSRILWLLRYHRWQGILSGICMIPAHFRTYSQYRERLESRIIRSYLALRRAPVPETL